jgi:hypothetical protein
MHVGWAALLIILYCRFDDQPAWYRALWALNNSVCLVVSRLPHGMRIIISETIAAAVSLLISWYADISFYVMRTDANDRFCTRLGKRFTRMHIEQMLVHAGFEQIRFSDSPPYRCAVGIRSQRGLSS